MARSRAKSRGGLLPSERRAQDALAAKAAAAAVPSARAEPVEAPGLPQEQAAAAAVDADPLDLSPDLDPMATDAAARLNRVAAEMSAERTSSATPEATEERESIATVGRVEGTSARGPTLHAVPDDVGPREELDPTYERVPIEAPEPEAESEPAAQSPAPPTFPANVSALPSADRRDKLRMLDALRVREIAIRRSNGRPTTDHAQVHEATRSFRSKSE